MRFTGLFERRRWRFALTGSSARKLRRGGVNLLAGRARTLAMHPLTAAELGDRFDLTHSVRYGQLPSVYVESDPKQYLASYVGTYLREEVQAEALTRNLEAFSRFLVAASFSQGAVLSISTIAREIGLPRKTVEGYFALLDDLLISVRLPVFTRRAKRAMSAPIIRALDAFCCMAATGNISSIASAFYLSPMPCLVCWKF
jgi:uncharacterized protein